MADNYLITGYWGEPHVTPENDRGINASIFGAGKFVLSVGERFRGELVGNNTFRLYDGKLMINGAAAGIPAGEYVDLSIPYASQGMMRSDIVAFQYEKDPSTLVETGKFVVVHGEEVPLPTDPDGEQLPPDPVLTTEDLLSDKATFDQFALWRVMATEVSLVLGNLIDEYSYRLYPLRPNATFNSLEELGLSDADMQGAVTEIPSAGYFMSNIELINKALPNYSTLRMMISASTPNLYDSFAMKMSLDTYMNVPLLVSGGTAYSTYIEISKCAGLYSPIKIDVLIDGGNRDAMYSCIFDATSAGTTRLSKFAPSYSEGARMVENTEYVTNEYWDGKALYTRLISFTWTAGGNNDYSISPEVCRYIGRVGDYVLPFINGTLNDANTAFCSLCKYNNKLRVMMQGGNTLNGKKAYLQLWYTK